MADTTMDWRRRILVKDTGGDGIFHVKRALQKMVS